MLCGLLFAKAYKARGWESRPSTAEEIGDLPYYTFKQAGETQVKPGAEAWLTTHAVETILDAGLIPILSLKGRNTVRVVNLQSIARPGSPLLLSGSRSTTSPPPAASVAANAPAAAGPSIVARSRPKPAEPPPASEPVVKSISASKATPSKKRPESAAAPPARAGGPPQSDEDLGQRTLAAVVFTDAVNFSKRASHDEEEALILLNRDIRLMGQITERFGGQVLKSTGDGLLIYFQSAIKAVACAMEIQRELTRFARTVDPSHVLEHRIGIHLGDVFVTENDVMGDSVNIAARLQTEAHPGGICISQIVHDVVKHRLQFEATLLGARELKNIREAMAVYEIRVQVTD
jgi:class 3 adenylate cyclase